MMSLEMLGYYSNEMYSQGYPIPILYLLYPLRGNFIAVVGSPKERGQVAELKEAMALNSDVPVYAIRSWRFDESARCH